MGAGGKLREGKGRRELRARVRGGRKEPKDEALFVVGFVFPSSIPRGVSSPFPLPSLQSTLEGKMSRVRTRYRGFGEVTVARGGSCPRRGSPDTPISLSCDSAALDLLGDSFFLPELL